MLAALFYSALAGFSLATQRAMIMVFVFFISVLLKRRMSVWQGLSVALLIIILLEPLAPLSAGFWLSFVAVGVLLYGLSQRLAQPKKLVQWGRAQYVVTIGLLPLSLWYFHQSPLIGWIANMIAIPWVGMLVLPLLMVAVLIGQVSSVVGGALLKFALTMLDGCWKFLSLLASEPSVVWQHSVPSGWWIVLASVGVIILLAPRGFPARYIGLMWLLPIFIVKPPQPNAGELWLTVLDVGQGLAVVVQTQKHTLVYDTGPRYSANFDTGSAVVLPYLRARGINNIDKLIVSHGDNDHRGGAKSILNKFHDAEVMTSVPEKFKKFNVENCYAGQHWEWDGVKFLMIHPDEGASFKGNNTSCVLRIDVGNKSVLLVGDIEKKAEKYLLQHHSGDLHATIIVAPHHGSKTSSSKKFLEVVLPEYVVYTTGYMNKFHFPSKLVTQRYDHLGAVAFNTADAGGVSFRLGATSSKTLVLKSRTNPIPVIQ